MCVLDYVPFVYQRTEDRSRRVDVKGLIQAGIIGAIVMYGTQQSVKVEIESIKTSLNDVRKTVDRMHNDLYTPRHG